MDHFCVTKTLSISEQLLDSEVYISFITIHNSGTVTLKKSTTDNDIIFKINNSSSDSKHFTFPYPIKVKQGIYVDLSPNTIVTIGYFG